MELVSLLTRARVASSIQATILVIHVQQTARLVMLTLASAISVWQHSLSIQFQIPARALHLSTKMPQIPVSTALLIAQLALTLLADAQIA